MALQNITWDPVNKGSGITLSNNNLTVINPNNSNTARATKGKTKGKWYWEIRVDVLATGLNSISIGIVNTLAGVGATGSSANAMYYYSYNGNKLNGSGTSYGQPYVQGDIISVLLDLDNGTIEFWKNGVSQGIAFNTVKNLGEVYPAVTSGTSGSNIATVTANFGNTNFVYPIPSGYKPYAWEDVNKILIQLSNGDYISVGNGGYTNDLVPKLTSNTDVLYGNSFNSTGFEAYKTFDDDGTTGVQTNSGVNPNGLYIGYDFKTKVKISAYRLKCRGTSTTRMIKKWDFQGSDDGVVWNTLDSRSNVTDWVPDTFKTFDLPQQVEYKMYRIYVYENNGDASYTSIGEIEFVDKNSNIVKLLTSLTEQDLIDYGMDKFTVLDLSQTMSRKSFVEKNTTTLGSGKVFSKSIDTTQLPIKKLTIK